VRSNLQIAVPVPVPVCATKSTVHPKQFLDTCNHSWNALRITTAVTILVPCTVTLDTDHLGPYTSPSNCYKTHCCRL